MKNKENNLWLLYAFVIAAYIAAVSILTFSVPHLSYPESYLNLIEAGKAQLSGRIVINSFLNLFGEFARLAFGMEQIDAIFKLFSVIVSGIIVLVSGIIAYKISDNVNKTLFSTMVLIGSPALFLLTFNTVFTETLALLFFLLTFLVWESSLRGKKKFILASIMMGVSVVATPLSAVLLLIFLFYFILQKIERRQIPGEELETFFFSIVLYLAYYTFLLRGLLVGSYARKVISEMISPFFQSLVSFDYITIVPVVGIVPLLIGAYCIYEEITSEKKSNKSAYLLSAAASVSFLLIFTSLVNIYFLLALLSISLSIISSLFLTNLNSFLRKSRLKFNTRKFFVIAVISANILFAALYVPEVISENINHSPSRETVEFLRSISAEYPNKKIISALEAVPAVLVFHGESAFAGLIAQGQEKELQKKVSKAYLSPFESQMLVLMESTSAECIIFTEFERRAFNVSSLKAIAPERISLEKNITGNLLYCMRSLDEALANGT